MPSFAWVSDDPWAFGPARAWEYDKSKPAPVYPPWDLDAKEPNSNGVDRCVEMKVAPPTIDGEFNDEACWKTRPALCECDVPGEVCNHDGKVDPGEECDDGNTHGGDGCSAACVVECPVGDNDGAFKDPVSHRCYVVPKTSKNWADAQGVCSALGSTFHLARVDSIDEFRFLSLAARKYLNLGTPPLWVDGTDAAAEGSWRFGTLPNNPSLPFPQNVEPWDVGEPNGKTGENCLSFYWYGDAYMLADLGCGYSTRPICERE